MKKVAVGFRAHSGWSAAVVVSLEKGAPVVLRRMRLRMVKTFGYAYRQPYHTAEKMELAEAEKFVAGVRAEAEELTCEALRAAGHALSVVTGCGTGTYDIDCDVADITDLKAVPTYSDVFA